MQEGTGKGKKTTANLSKRPNTTAMKFGSSARPFTGMNTNYGGSYAGINFMGGRALSAATVMDPKFRRKETLVNKLKRILEDEKKELR